MTYETAVEITKKSEAFYESIVYVDGYKVSLFNYMFAGYSDFAEHDAYELRGLCYVFDENGQYKKFQALNKFFNINENQSTMYAVVKDKKIVNVGEKCDGSMITFIELPNGKIVPKTKMSFSNEQCDLAKEIYNDKLEIREFVQWCIANEYTSIFELVSPHNKIVLDYSETELILLQVRDKQGRYVPLSVLSNVIGLINITKQLPPVPLEELIEKQETEEDCEGWVVEFEDGQMIKMKTKWYFENHKLLTDDLTREDFIIEKTLEETIDDVLSQVKSEDPRRKWVESVSQSVNHYVDSMVDHSFHHVKTSYTGDRKAFANTNKHDPLFGIYMAIINKEADMEQTKNIVKSFVMKKTNTLSKSREWLYAEVGFKGKKV